MSSDAVALSLPASAYEWRTEERYLKTTLSDPAADRLLLIASYLTDPICKMRECYLRIWVVDALNPTSSPMINTARKVLLAASAFSWGMLALLTTAPAIGLRAIAIYLSINPYTYLHVEGEDKAMPPEKEFTLFLWNNCCIPAGHTISDGGVTPWEERIGRIAKHIADQDSDVVCLNETFDPQTARLLSNQLIGQGYRHFYYNIHPLPVGVSSGLFVASKYKISNPEFTRFPAHPAIQDSQYSAKGVFEFDLESEGKQFARIFTTHLQHSILPGYPTPEEKEARKNQMELIVERVNRVRDRCIVVTGDLNLDDEEYQKSEWSSHFEKGDRYFPRQTTWGGDAFCNRLMNRAVSSPRNLDHTMIRKKSAQALETIIIPAGFDGNQFRQEALSDHEGLFTKIRI